MVVNGKLGKSQPFRPKFLFFSTEDSQILLHFPIHDLHLTIHLWVMRHRKLRRDSESLAEICHDLRGELWTLITNNGARESMILPDME